MRLKKARMLVAVSISTVATMLIAASPAQADATITNLESMLANQSRAVYWGGLHSIFLPPWNITETKATPVGTPKVVTSAPYFLGCAKLTNNTASDQTLKSNAFSREYTNTISTTVTTGVSSTDKVSGSFKLSEVANVGVEKTVTVSYSEAETQTDTIKEKHTAPAQNVFVPAGQTRYVIAQLTPSTYSGTMSLNTTIQGTFLASDVFNPLVVNQYGVYDVLSQATSKGTVLPAGFSLNASTKALNFKGTGTYSMTAGANFHVNVSDKLPSGVTSTCA